MKTFRLSILLALSVLATTAASAQTRPAARTTTTTTTKPASTAAKPASTTTTRTTTTTKPASKPATTTTKPAAKPASAAAEEPAATPAKSSAASQKTATKSSNATTNTFGVGSMAANVGVGLGLNYGYGLFTGIHSTPALSVSLERGIIDNVGPGVISVGGLIGYKRYSWNYSGYHASWNNFIVAARGAYHYNFTDNPKVDTYAGLSLGVRVESYSSNYDVYSNSYGGVMVTSGAFIGGRYMFANNIGGFAELGYDMSFLKLGLTARF